MTALWSPRRANCLIWAIVMQLTRGGYVCWRKSWYGWWPHAVWSLDRVDWYEYVPLQINGRMRWWQLLRMVVFAGSPRKIDRGTL